MIISIELLAGSASISLSEDDGTKRTRKVISLIKLVALLAKLRKNKKLTIIFTEGQNDDTLKTDD